MVVALLQGTRLLSGRPQFDSVGTLPASFVVTKTTFLQKLTELTFSLVIGLGSFGKSCFSYISYQPSILSKSVILPPDGKKQKPSTNAISDLLLSYFVNYSMVIMAWHQDELK